MNIRSIIRNLISVAAGLAFTIGLRASDLESLARKAVSENPAESGPAIAALRAKLGKLDEELSCANSRFFRTTLYANTEVAKYLREHFVLHWKSVRPVPKITIDFGDGRKLERTITGNSIHYVLDTEGRVVDARLDNSSKSLMRGKNPSAHEAARRTESKRFVEDPFMRVIFNLERSIAEDTVRNECLFHRQIHEWLAGGTVTGDVEAL